MLLLLISETSLENWGLKELILMKYDWHVDWEIYAMVIKIIDTKKFISSWTWGELRKGGMVVPESTLHLHKPRNATKLPLQMFGLVFAIFVFII